MALALSPGPASPPGPALAGPGKAMSKQAQQREAVKLFMSNFFEISIPAAKWTRDRD